MMRLLAGLPCAALLSACGLVGTAATGAAGAASDAEAAKQAKQTEEQLLRKLDAAQQTAAENRDKALKAAEQ